MPTIVARGSVRSGSLTSSAGTVADSRPMNAQSVSVPAVVMSLKRPPNEAWLGANGVKFPLFM